MEEIFRMLKNRDIASLVLKPTNNPYVQMLRYAFVGGATFVVDAGCLWILVVAGQNKYFATTIGFAVGLIVNYALSKSLVFKKEKQRVNNIIEFIIYGLIGIVGLLLTQLIIYIFTDILNMHVIISKIISALLVLIWNFSARKKIIYRKKNS